MAVAWPGFLQSKLNEAGFGLDYQDNMLKSSPEVGPPKSRVRNTKRIDIYTCTIMIQISDFTNWDTFFTTDLNNGVNPFDFIHPFTGILRTFKFAAPPKISPMGGTYLSISMGWILLP